MYNIGTAGLLLYTLWKNWYIVEYTATGISYTSKTISYVKWLSQKRAEGYVEDDGYENIYDEWDVIEKVE